MKEMRLYLYTFMYYVLLCITYSRRNRTPDKPLFVANVFLDIVII